MIVETKAIVFSAIKFSEADLIVCCFTKTDGVKSYLLRNILKSKKSKIKASYFQPLTQLELVATHKNKGSLEFIREAKVAVPYQSLHTDMMKTGLVMFLSEMLKNCIREEEANPELYSFLERSFLWLDENDSVANFHIQFLLQLSHYLGFYPDASRADLPYFNMIEGNFEQSDSGHYSLEGETVENFKVFFNISLDESALIKLSRKSRSDLLELIMTYYQLHVQGYKKPKSLDILNQLFN